MGVRKALDSKSDLERHSRSLALLTFDRPHMISLYSSTATMSLFCTIPRYYQSFPKTLKRSRNPKHRVALSVWSYV